MVHNIAKDKGKEIDFKIKGADVSEDKKIIEDIKEFAKSLSLETLGVTTSPIQGAKQGNTEYLIYLRRI